MSKDFVKQYAKALFEVAGDIKHQTSYLNELRTVEKIFIENVSIVNFFKSVEITSLNKVQIVSKAMTKVGLSEDVVSMIKLLIERNKISFYSKIVLAYQDLNDEVNGLVRGTVKSSHELDSQQRKSISEKIESVLKKKVILDYVLDMKVIGGLKAQVGSHTFDDTFQTHFKKMKDQINRRTH